FVSADCRELAVLDGDGTSRRIGAVQRRERSAMQNEIWHIRSAGHEEFSDDFALNVWASSAWRPGSIPNTCDVHFESCHATGNVEPESTCLPTGMTCSPTRIPSSPTSATSGGAGERTSIRA